MQILTFKEEAKLLVDSLPENSSWNDLMYEIYVRQEIEKGLDDIEAGRYKTHEEVEKIFGVTE